MGSYVGGLASSFVDDAGFTWDLGGHVIFSHYEYYDQVLDLVVPEWIDHVRESWVWISQRFIPYPFQCNVWRLPENQLEACLNGLVDQLQCETDQTRDDSTEVNFKSWLLSQFGEGLCEIFQFPYNFKVWATPLDLMASSWVAERVAPVNFKQVLKSVIYQQDQLGWGPNSTFRFPGSGGTGQIWSNVASKLRQERVVLNASVSKIVVDFGSASSDTLPRKRVQFTNGHNVFCNFVISTLPLDCLLQILDIRGSSEYDDLPKPSQFKFSSTHVVGIGVEGPIPASMQTKCWLYFPESNCPFYRATIFSNYSPANVPNPSKHWYAYVCSRVVK